MSVFAISDLHLSFSSNKPMSVFGEIWEDYEKLLKFNWTQKIRDNDLVILPRRFFVGNIFRRNKA